MPHRTLKTKPPNRTLLDRQLFAVPELLERRAQHLDESARRPRSRWCWLAVALSLVLHGGAALVCWFHPLKGSGLVVIDTRVADSPATEASEDVHFFITFSEFSGGPRPALPPVPQPVADAIAPPVVIPNGTEAIARSTAPLNPSFNQRLAQGEPAAREDAGNGEPGAQSGRGSVGGVTSFFQIAARGQRIVYVIDRSSSMGETGAFALAKRELHASLARLLPEARFQVIAYNRSAEPLRLNGQGGLLPATLENKRQAALRIDALRAEGGTEHLTALQQALRLQPDVLFLLTDADALTDDQVRTITHFNQGRTVIHTIELTTSHSTSTVTPLQLLARENRGIYRAVKLNG
jgi:hypothetical protein